MSREVQGMLIQIEATTAQLRREMASADQVVTRTSRQIDRQLNQVDTAFDRTAKRAQQAGNMLRSAFAVAAGAGMIGNIIKQADAYGEMAERVRDATTSTAEYQAVQARLRATADGTYRSLAEAQETYIQSSRGLKQLGYSTNETLDIVDSLSYAFVRNATSSDKAQSAMTALVRATNRGSVLTDHWASLLVAVPTLLDNIADATGMTAEEVSKLGYAGQLSAQMLTEGLRKSLDENKAAADEMATTVGDALTKINNAMQVYFGELNQGTGATNKLAESLAVIADNFDILAKVAGGAAAVVGARMAGAAATSTAAFVAGQVQAARYQAALASMAGVSRTTAVALTTMGAATRAANAALAVVGGPMGAAILAAGAVAYFATRTSEADREAEALDKRINKLGDSFEKLGADQAAAAILDYDAKLAAATLTMKSAEARVFTLQRNLEQFPNSKRAAEWATDLVRARGAAADAKDEVDELRATIARLSERLDNLKGSSEGAAAGMGALGEAATKFIDANNKRVDALWAGNDPIKQAVLHIKEHGQYTREESEAILASATALKTATDAQTRTNAATQAGIDAAKAHTAAIDALISKYDPATKAQAEYEKAVAVADKALARNGITTKQYQQILKGLTSDLNKPIWDKHNKAVAEAEALYKQLDDQVSAIRDRLDPLQAATRKLAQEKELLARAVDEGAMSLEEYELRLRQLDEEYEKNTRATTQWTEWTESALERVDSAFADAWRNIGSGFKGFRDNLVNGFKQMLAELAHLAITRPIVMQIGAALGIGGMSTSAMAGGVLGGGSGSGGIGGLANLFSLGKGGLGLLDMIKSGSLMSSLGGAASNFMFGFQGLHGPLGAGSTLATQLGSFAGSLANMAGPLAAIAGALQGWQVAGLKGAVAGAGGGLLGFKGGAALGSLAGPLGTAIGGAIGAALGAIGGSKIFGSGEKYKRTVGSATGYYSDGQYTSTGVNAGFYGGSRTFGKDFDQDLDHLNRQFNEVLGSVFEAFDIDSELSTTLGVRLRRTSGRLATDFGVWIDGELTRFTDQFGGKGDVAKGMEQFSEALMGTYLASIIQATESLPEYFRDQFEGLTDSVDVTSTIAEIFLSFDSVNQALELTGHAAFELTDAGMKASDELLALSGGLDMLQASTAAYQQHFVSAEQQRLAYAEQMATAISQAGHDIDASGLLNMTKDQYAALIEAQDLTTESGRELWAALMELSGGFAELAGVWDTLEEERWAAEIDLLVAMGKEEEALSRIREKQMRGLTDEQKAYMTATEAMREHAAELAAENARWTELKEARQQVELDLLMITGREEEALRIQREAMLEVLTEEQLAYLEATEAMQEHLEQLQSYKALANVGSTGKDISEALRQGILAEWDGENIGGFMAETVHSGIMNSVATGFADQITQIFMAGIVEPMVVAAMTGSSVSEAVSRDAIANIIAQAQAFADAAAVVMQELAGLEDILKDLFSGLDLPTSSAAPPPAVGGGGYGGGFGGGDAGGAVAAVEDQWQKLLENLKKDIEDAQYEIANIGLGAHEKAIADLHRQADEYRRQLEKSKGQSGGAGGADGVGMRIGLPRKTSAEFLEDEIEALRLRQDQLMHGTLDVSLFDEMAALGVVESRMNNPWIANQVKQIADQAEAKERELEELLKSLESTAGVPLGQTEEMKELGFDSKDAVDEWLESQIKLLEAQKEMAAWDKLNSERAQIEIDLLRAQGREEEALALIRAEAIEGMNAEQIAYWDATQAMRDQIEALREADRIWGSLEADRTSVEIELLRELGQESEALARERLLAIEGMNAEQIAYWDATQAVRDHISAIQAERQARADAAAQAMSAANAAFGLVQRSINAEKDRLTAAFNIAAEQERESIQRANEAAQAAANARSAALSASVTAARETVGILASLDRAIGSALNRLRSTEEGVVALHRRQAVSMLQDTLTRTRSGESIAGIEGLEDALSVVSTLDPATYRTFEDFQREQGRTANLVADLQEVNGKQLSTEERVLEQLQLQYESSRESASKINISTSSILQQLEEEYEQAMQALDEQLDAAQEQIDALNGIDNSVMAVSEAVSRMQDAIVHAINTQPPPVVVMPPPITDIDAAYEVPQFAKGGHHAGGIRLVGEHGPELEITGPSRIYSASQTASALQGGVQTVAAIEKLEGAVRSQGDALRSIAKHTHRTAERVEMLERWDYDGMPEPREAV